MEKCNFQTGQCFGKRWGWSWEKGKAGQAFFLFFIRDFFSLGINEMSFYSWILIYSTTAAEFFLLFPRSLRSRGEIHSCSLFLIFFKKMRLFRKCWSGSGSQEIISGNRKRRWISYFSRRLIFIKILQWAFLKWNCALAINLRPKWLMFFFFFFL